MGVAILTILTVAFATGSRAEAFKTPVWSAGTVGNLEVAIDGRPVPVNSVQTPDDHLILLLVLDTVKYPDRFDAAQEALIAKLTALGPNYYVGVLTAQDGLVVRQDPVRSRRRLRERLEAIDVRGVPGLLDVVVDVSRVADATLNSADVRLAVLFLTDGEIEDYRGDYTIPVVNPSDRSDLSRRFGAQLILERVRSVTDSLESAQAPLFFIHLARRHDDLNEVYQNGISEFASVTGGQALFAQGLQEIPALVEQILDEIASHSVLTLDVKCEGPVRLQVTLSGASTRHRDSFRCP
ncbi:MAG: hypothetical protein OXN89_24200 [Bryobacterales bacterium]|nr:hypothetical protein [Bryobacterales bacterium]